MQVKLLFSNAISDLETRTDEFLSSLPHDIIRMNIINTVENFEHRYIEFIIYDDLDEIDEDEVEIDNNFEFCPQNEEVECTDEIDENDETVKTPLNKIKILRANRVQDLELKINTYLNEVKSKIGSFPITEVVQDIIIKQYDTSNCEYKYIAWVLHDLVILNACEEIKN